MRRRYSAPLIGLLIAASAFAVLHRAFATIAFPAKNGLVTYDHAAHTVRQKFTCWECHNTPFPLFGGPIRYKPILHKAAEAAKASCGRCHRPGGEAFASHGNCRKCHIKAVPNLDG